MSTQRGVHSTMAAKSIQDTKKYQKMIIAQDEEHLDLENLNTRYPRCCVTRCCSLTYFFQGNGGNSAHPIQADWS